MTPHVGEAVPTPPGSSGWNQVFILMKQWSSGPESLLHRWMGEGRERTLGSACQARPH